MLQKRTMHFPTAPQGGKALRTYVMKGENP